MNDFRFFSRLTDLIWQSTDAWNWGKAKWTMLSLQLPRIFRGSLTQCDATEAIWHAPPVMIPDQDGTVQVRSSGRIGLKADYGSNAIWLIPRILQGCEWWSPCVVALLVWKDVELTDSGFLIVPGLQWYTHALGSSIVAIHAWMGMVGIYSMHARMGWDRIGDNLLFSSPPPLASLVGHYWTRMDRPGLLGPAPQWAVTLRRNVWTTFQSSLAFFRGPH